MAEKRDLLDELIDIQADWNALSHTGNDLVDQFTSGFEDMPEFNPADYEEQPRVSSVMCSSAIGKNPELCDLCMAVCPTNAISFSGTSLRVGKSCVQCGLCAAVCPTEALQLRKNAPLTAYDKIARVASAYEQCYITCARALDRLPKPNEIVLPCVGVLSREVWFDLLCDFPNLNVFLPLDVCEDCSVSTGEELLGEAIATGEEWSGETVGLEVDENELNHEQKRAYKRSQFVSSVTQAGTRLVTRGNPALAGAQAVANRLRDHSQQISELQKTLEAAVGSQTSRAKRRTLTRKRRLLMAGLQKYPDLAEELQLAFPLVDEARCTMCGECAKVCTVHALEIDQNGRVTVEPCYCVNCEACVRMCPEGALSLEMRSTEDLVIPDPDAEKRRRRAVQARKTARDTLNKGFDALEGLADD